MQVMRVPQPVGGLSASDDLLRAYAFMTIRIFA